MATVKDIIGDATFNKISNHLKQAFPDPRVSIADHHVNAMALYIWQKFDAATCQNLLGCPKPDQAQIDQLTQDISVVMPSDGRSYYIAAATHSRIINPHHSFTAYLPLVKVELPQTDQEAVPITTAIGDINPTDRLLISVEQVAFKYQAELGYVPGKVELIAPARVLGARFGAIIVYTGYRNAADTTPSFYILEAGTATGETMMTFFSPDMGVIPPRKKWYAPTPFTTPDEYYTGQFVMNGTEPGELHVQALDTDQTTVKVKVDVVYEKSEPRMIYPALLTAEAAARVGAISVKKGELIFETLFAPIGFALPWKDYPS